MDQLKWFEFFEQSTSRPIQENGESRSKANQNQKQLEIVDIQALLRELIKLHFFKASSIKIANLGNDRTSAEDEKND